METKSIVVERLIPYSAEKIWRALTVPALVGEWFMQNDFAAQEGHRFIPCDASSRMVRGDELRGAESRGAAAAGL